MAVLGDYCRSRADFVKCNQTRIGVGLACRHGKTLASTRDYKRTVEVLVISLSGQLSYLCTSIRIMSSPGMFIQLNFYFFWRFKVSSHPSRPHLLTRQWSLNFIQTKRPPSSKLPSPEASPRVVSSWAQIIS